MSALRLFDKFQKLLDVTWPSIADGQTLKRSGSNIIGYTPGGGSGDVVGPSVSVDGELSAFSGTTGKIIKRPTQASGFAKHALNGAFTTQTTIGATDLASTVISGQTQKTTAIVDADEFLLSDSTAGPGLKRVAATLVRHLPGQVIQVSYTEYTAELSATAVLTPPFAIASGTEILSMSFTPKFANSKLLFTVTGQAAASVSGGANMTWTAAIYDNSTSTAIRKYIEEVQQGATRVAPFSFQYLYTPGNANARTYSVRVGPTDVTPVQAVYINGYGQVAAGYGDMCTLVIQEVKQ